MGPKKAKSKMPVDGVDTTSMSREQLEAFCIRLREELEREREERNFFQLERDKLRTFWEITRQQLDESRAQQRNQDRAIDELEEKHQAEIKVYKQKVKHLLYEHQCNLSELKVENVVSLKQAEDNYNAMEQQLLQDKKELKEQIHDLELAHLEEVRQLKIDHSAEVSRIREQLESDAVELEKKYEVRLTNQAEEQALREKMEQAELETRKNQHIVDLTKQHEAAFQEMKNYYNDITLNNLALISSLKEQMEELKANHDRMEKQLNACQSENKKLAEPYKEAQSELALLKRQLSSYEQDKVTLANTKQRLSLITKELEDLRWENDVLQLRFEKVEKERDRLHAEFVGAVLDVQQKTGLKGALLEKRMASMRSGVSHITSVSVTGDETRLTLAQKSSSCKTTRPATAPLRIPPSSSPDRVSEAMCRRKALAPGSRLLPRRLAKPLTKGDCDDAASRFESGAVRGRSRFKRPHISEHSKARWMKAFKSSSSRSDSTALAIAASQGASPRDSWLEAHNHIRNPRTNMVDESEPQTKDCWWTTSEKSTVEKETVSVAPCVCGQHVNGCRLTSFDKARQSVEALDLSFNYLSRNYMKHRYYPQILDCVRRSLSPIHSQEHPSDASIHDASDKPVASHPSSFQEERHSEEVPQIERPMSASRADGRDRAFTKRKTQQQSNFGRPSTAATVSDASKVFSGFVPLPPRPDLPWLHGVKSRYFSVHSTPKKNESTSCPGRPSTADIEIQTTPPLTVGSVKKRILVEDDTDKVLPDGFSDDETQCYLSHILNNPLQLSYSLGQRERNYAAVVATPKIGDFKVSNATPSSFVRTKTGDLASVRSSIEYPCSWATKVGRESDDNDSSPSRRLALSMWYSYLQKKSRKGDSHVLSMSPIRHIDIECVDSARSSPAIETPANSSHEDTRAGFSSMSASQPNSRKSSEPKESRRSDTTLKGLEQMDVDTSLAQSENPAFLNSSFTTSEKHERVSLKRKLKPTFWKRLKLKLMICSYLHHHDKEEHVNFVHPSVKQKSVETAVNPFQEALCFDKMGVSSGRESNFDISPKWEALLGDQENVKAPNGTVSTKESCLQDLSISEFFCCVCQIKLEELSEGDQICCDECTKNADALLGEWGHSEVRDLLSNDLLERSVCIISEGNVTTESADHSENAETDLPGTHTVPDEARDVADPFSNACADCMFREAGLLGDNFMTESPGDKISAKLAEDSYQTDFNAEPLDDVTLKENCGGDSEIKCLDSGAEFMSPGKRIGDIIAESFDRFSAEADTLSKTRSFADKHTTDLDDHFSKAGIDVFSSAVASKTELDIADASAPLLPQGRFTEDPFYAEFYEQSSTAKPEGLFLEGRFVGDTAKSDFSSNAATPNKEFSTGIVSDPFERHLLKERNENFEEGAERTVVFTLSRVQEAVRSAMKMIDPVRPSATDSAIRDDFFHPVTSELATVVDFPSSVNAPQVPNTPESPTSLGCETKKIPLSKSNTNIGGCSPPRANSVDETKSNTRSRKTDNASLTKTWQRHICPLAVPQGTLRGDPKKIIYKEYPLQTSNFPSSSLRCLSKPRKLLVFYEVSRNKDEVKTKKKWSVEKEGVKEASITPSSVFVASDASAANIRKQAVCLPNVPHEERLKSVGTTANLSCSRSNVRSSDVFRPLSKSAPPCDSKLDLMMSHRRRESWLLSGKGTSSKEISFAESGKFRHRPEVLNEDDTRLPHGRQDPLNANRDSGCLCLKRGRKCNCSLTKHLHICPLPPPRPQRRNVFSFSPKISERAFGSYETPKPPETFAEKYPSNYFKKNVTFFKPKESLSDGAEFLSSKGLSRIGSPPFTAAASMKNVGALKQRTLLGRQEKAKASDVLSRLVETMPSLIEEPLSGDSSGDENSSSRQFDANATQSQSASTSPEVAPGRASPAVPTPPPPSPTAFLPSPPSSLRSDRLPRRRTGNVSFRGLQDGTESARFLPQLPLRQRRHSQDGSLDERFLDNL